jgi:hypothetical protein
MDDKQKSVIEHFTGSLGQLDKVLAPVPESGWEWSEKEGEWTIRQILHHLAEDMIVYGFILERALATPGCKVFFGEFPGNQEWADRLGFNQRPVCLALDLIRAQRPFFSELFSLFPGKWENTVLFYNETGEKLAESNVEKMIEMLSDHMDEHVQMIEKIIASKE